MSKMRPYLRVMTGLRAKYKKEMELRKVGYFPCKMGYSSEMLAKEDWANQANIWCSTPF